MDIFITTEMKYGLIVSIIGVALYFLHKYFAGGVCKSTVPLDGKVVLITGANTGIGKETAIDLARRGAKVYIACRDPIRGSLALQDIKQKSMNNNVHLRIIDLASFESIDKFAECFLKEESMLHILVNNAGIAFCPYQKTNDGLEMQMGVNHFGHFLLTSVLLDVIINSSPSRIINVSSEAHRYGVIDFDDFFGEKKYDRLDSYSNSKLANILFTKELSNRLDGTDVSVFALTPGHTFTEIGRHIFTDRSIFYRIIVTIWYFVFIYPMTKNINEGAQTTIYCAVEEGLASQSGKYFSDCRIKEPSKIAMDDGIAKKLWEYSENIVICNFPYENIGCAANRTLFTFLGPVPDFKHLQTGR